MKRLLMFIGILVLTTGCSAHYHKVHDGVLDLYLADPGAQEVSFACSLDGFSPHPARRIDDCWVVSLPADDSFRYYYVVDGKNYLPSCPMKENDDFGSQNCVFDPCL